MAIKQEWRKIWENYSKDVLSSQVFLLFFDPPYIKQGFHFRLRFVETRRASIPSLRKT